MQADGRHKRRQGRLAWRQAGGRQPIAGIPLSHYNTSELSRRPTSVDRPTLPSLDSLL